MCTYIGHPFGSLMSGFISDALGRRKALMLVVAPAVLAFIMLGLAESFEVVFVGFLLLSFIFGLKGKCHIGAHQRNFCFGFGLVFGTTIRF